MWYGEVDFWLCTLCLQSRYHWIQVDCFTVSLLYSLKWLTRRPAALIVFWLWVISINLSGTALPVFTALHWSVSDLWQDASCQDDCWSWTPAKLSPPRVLHLFYLKIRQNVSGEEYAPSQHLSSLMASGHSTPLLFLVNSHFDFWKNLAAFIVDML